MRNLAEQVLADLPGAPELLLAAPGAHELAWRDWVARIRLTTSPAASRATGWMTRWTS